MEIPREHSAIVDAAIAAHAGRTVKTMGDGYMAVFASAEAGVRCALDVQAAFAHPAEALQGIRVRIGVHAGRAVRDHGDFFGREVNYAARVADTALGGEVVVSEAVHERIGSVEAVSVSARREVELKGFAGSHGVFTLRRPGGPASA